MCSSDLKHPGHLEQMRKSNGGIQFSHTLEEQINGQLEAGFTLTHLYDDTNGSGNLRDHNITSYIATRSVKGKSNYIQDGVLSDER